MRLALAFLLALAAPVAAEPTLADLRTELSALKTGLQSLRNELLASGAAGYEAAGGDSAIDRMNGMEAALRQLTARIETAESRVSATTAELTHRADDLEFRLCEMDETCELGALTTPDAPMVSITAAPPPPAEMTDAERQAWDAAQAVLAGGDPARAAEMFGALAKGPLTAEALDARGAALRAAGDVPGAGQAWLDAFAANPSGPRAPAAMLGIAGVLEAQGKVADACGFLADLTLRFPGNDASAEAATRQAKLGCDGG